MKNFTTLAIIICLASSFVRAQKQVELATNISRIKNKDLYLGNDDVLNQRNIKSIQNTVYPDGKNFKENTDNDFLLDSIYKYDFSSETDSLLNSRVLYEYNEQGSLTQEITEYWNSDTETWVNYSKIEREYNEHQELILKILYNWNSANNEWVGNIKDEYDYDENGYISLQAKYIWNINSEVWFGSSRFEYVKNEQGKNIKYTTFNWNIDNAEWIYKDKREYEYYEQVLETLLTAYVWDSAIEEWAFSWKLETEYNEYEVVANVFYYEWNNVSETWQYTYKEESEFDEQGKITLWSSFSYNNTSEDWIFDAKREYEYDEDDFLILTLRHNWNTTSEEWVKYSKYEYEYDENGFISVEALYLWNIANEVWAGDRKYEIETNEYGLYILFIRYLSWDSVNETWIPTSKTENDFNGGSSWEEITCSASYYWDSVNEIWIGTSKTVYEKNELNDILLMTEFDWDYNTNEWALSSKSFYYYSATFSVFVTINPIGAGSVSGQGTHNSSTEVTLEATANDGYEFVYWTDGENVISDNALYTFTMPEADVSLTANFSEVTAILDIANVYNIQIYPNPARDYINIIGIENAETIEILSIMGKTIKLFKRNDIDNQFQINTSDLQNGVYIINVYSGKQIFSRKIIVNKH